MPLPGGLRTTVRFDPVEQVMAPYRKLSFPVVRHGTTWVSWRISLLETDDLLGTVPTLMLSS